MSEQYPETEPLSREDVLRVCEDIYSEGNVALAYYIYDGYQEGSEWIESVVNNYLNEID